MIAVITTVAGRHDHLRRQLAGLRRGTRQPDRHVVVAMGDPQVGDVCRAAGHPAVDVIELGRDPLGLPVAAARNAGARRALAAGADVLTFLDVDCIPGPSLVARYAELAAGPDGGALLSGTVAYLPQAGECGYDLSTLAASATPHPARPAPAEREIRPLDHEMFWSLSFAVRAEVWSALGGFCERYVGYGGEDTDFGQLARVRGVAHLAVGGAPAYHQWHPAPDPPLHHMGDILRNGRIFRDRWGWWPMAGWLSEFADLGLVAHDAQRDDWIEAGSLNSVPDTAPTP